MKVPKAARVPYTHTEMNDPRPDPWHWLKDKANPATIRYLEAENGWAEAQTAHTEKFRKALFEEMLGRIQEDDSTAPYRKGVFWYYTRTEEGRSYPVYCRRRDGTDAEEVLLDVNLLAEGKTYTRVGDSSVSPDHTRLAYTVDHDGSEVFTLVILDLATRAVLSEVKGAYYGLAWANDNATIYYTTMDAAHRPYRLNRHRVGQTQDTVVFEEPDERFFLSVSRLRSGRYLLMSLGSHTTSELHLIDADSPEAVPQRVRERRQDVEYGLDHHEDRLFIWTNADDAVNFKLVSAPVSDPASWTDVVPYDPAVNIKSVLAFATFLAVFERRRGLPMIRILPLDGGEPHDVAFPEAAYSLSPEANPEFTASAVRFSYSSPITAPSTFSWDVPTRERTLLKQDAVLGGFSPDNYVVERIEFRADDGTAVPVTITRRRDVPLNGTAPTYLRGYGSYGAIYDPSFSYATLSLLERGVICCTAHIRGGGELGRTWYEDGKLDRKMNTFTDFITAGRGLAERGYTAPEKLAIYGGSAGGLLIGAVLNMAPDLCGVAVADVPFVDSLNTMLDATLPLTVIEYEEWGNPNESEAYATMKAYAPYENTHAGPYPDMLVLAGLNDPRVGYWEPAKWVAKLRATAQTQTLLLKTEMGAGHAGKSGRYGRLEDVAYIYSFILDHLGVSVTS